MIIIKDSIKKVDDRFFSKTDANEWITIKINKNGLLTVNEGITIHFSGYIEIENPTIDQITDFINDMSYNITVE
jgi:hypothetical protein